ASPPQSLDSLPQEHRAQGSNGPTGRQPLYFAANPRQAVPQNHAGCKTRDDGSVEGQTEGELYRKIIRRAKEVRERAAESLRRSRASRKRQAGPGGQADAAQKRRRFRRGD